MTAALVATMKDAILVVESAPGEGSCFHFSLPSARASAGGPRWQDSPS